jgi:hypothetical protein
MLLEMDLSGVFQQFNDNLFFWKFW